MMNIAIVYSSKYGATEKMAQLIAHKIGTGSSVSLVYLRKSAIPDLASYDKVVLGTPIYGGKPSGSMTRFCKEKKEELTKKVVGLFVCGLEGKEEKRKEELKSAYPDYLHSVAVADGFLGGEINIEKLNFFERLVMRMMGKKSSFSAFRNDAIEAFCKKL